MSQELSIGLILPALPGYSETFIHSKINGLLHHGFKVSLFVAGKGDLKSIPITVPVYFQININNKLCLLPILITSFILHPLVCIRFIKLEKFLVLYIDYLFDFPLVVWEREKIKKI